MGNCFTCGQVSTMTVSTSDGYSEYTQRRSGPVKAKHYSVEGILAPFAAREVPFLSAKDNPTNTELWQVLRDIGVNGKTFDDIYETLRAITPVDYKPIKPYIKAALRGDRSTRAFQAVMELESRNIIDVKNY